MEVEFDLTPEDLQAFDRFDQQRQKGQKVFRGLSWPWVVLLCLLGLMYVYTDGLGALFPVLIGAVFGGLGMLALIVRVHKVAVRSQDRFANDKRNLWVFSTRRVTISPEEFAESSWYGRGAQRWDVIWDIGVTADHVFFCTTTLAAHVVPRRAFRDQRHFDEFVALARRYQEGTPASTGITATPPRPTTITHAPSN